MGEALISGSRGLVDPGRTVRGRARGVSVLLLLPLLALPSCGRPGNGSGASPAAAQVTAETATPRDVPVTFEFVAQTQSSRQVNIQARVTGFLEKRLYTEGSPVKQGQVLFLMDTKPFQAQLDAEVAALARQQASLEVARADLARTKPLAAQNALSQKDLDDATGQFHAAEAAVEGAKARVETAKLNLSYCTIASPVTGVAGAALQQDGSFISPQTSLLTTVAALDPMWVNFSVSENQMQAYQDALAKGRVQAPKDDTFVVEVILVNGAVFPHLGRITFAAPAYNAQTGTFLLRASVENPQGVLRPNQYVRVRLQGAIRPHAILVPQRAVQQGSAGQFVWLVDDKGNAQSRPVVVGQWDGANWQISEGLQAGDRVIVDGTLALRPGVPVSVKPAAAGK